MSSPGMTKQQVFKYFWLSSQTSLSTRLTQNHSVTMSSTINLVLQNSWCTFPSGALFVMLLMPHISAFVQLIWVSILLNIESLDNSKSTTCLETQDVALLLASVITIPNVLITAAVLVLAQELVAGTTTITMDQTHKH